MRGIIAKASMAAFTFAGTPASAQLSVDRLWVDFEPGTPHRADIVVRNESPDRYYITVTPAEIIDPGTDTEKRIEQSDPEQLGLLVTPNRLVIDPGGSRSIRIVSLNQNVPKDRIYRVKVTPQVGDIQASAPEGGRGIAIKVLAAYDILVTSRPDKAKAELTATHIGDELIITNAGNSNTLLYEGKACSKSGDTKTNDDPAAECTDLGARRLYAGNVWKIGVPASQIKIQFKQRSTSSSNPKETDF
jgi:P pilus assembly chaperone PapD